MGLLYMSRASHNGYAEHPDRMGWKNMDDKVLPQHQGQEKYRHHIAR